MNKASVSIPVPNFRTQAHYSDKAKPNSIKRPMGFKALSSDDESGSSDDELTSSDARVTYPTNSITISKPNYAVKLHSASDDWHTKPASYQAFSDEELNFFDHSHTNPAINQTSRGKKLNLLDLPIELLVNILSTIRGLSPQDAYNFICINIFMHSLVSDKVKNEILNDYKLSLLFNKLSLPLLTERGIIANYDWQATILDHLSNNLYELAKPPIRKEILNLFQRIKNIKITKHNVAVFLKILSHEEPPVKKSDYKKYMLIQVIAKDRIIISFSVNYLLSWLESQGIKPILSEEEGVVFNRRIHSRIETNMEFFAENNDSKYRKSLKYQRHLFTFKEKNKARNNIQTNHCACLVS
jgi:hypothetical protein